MKEYEDKTKKWKIRNIMHLRTPVAFRVIEELEADGMIEDYDTFRGVSERFNDVYIFYMDGQYYAIDRDKKDFKRLNSELLEGEYFVLNKCITNNIQGYLQKYGTEALSRFNKQEFVEVMLAHRDSLLSIEEER